LLVNFAETKTQNIVKVESSFERLIRNRSAYPQTLKNYVSVDEWGRDAEGKSEILECTMVIDGDTYSAPVNTPKVLEFSIEVTTEERQLKPNQTCTLRTKWVEYKTINDTTFYHFSNPTLNPEIAVKPLQGMGVTFGFGAPSDVEESHYESRKRLAGTYLPHQHMFVRWWPKSAT
jgi:hypothetical protein